MEQRLPKMRARPLDESNVCTSATPERVAEARDKLQTSSSATDDNDTVEFAGRG
jgi:hypothetical protein